MINDITSASERRFYYVSGQPVELWENSDSPFGWSSDDLEVYANDDLVGEPSHRHEDGTQLLDSRLLSERTIHEWVALGLANEVGELGQLDDDETLSADARDLFVEVFASGQGEPHSRGILWTASTRERSRSLAP